MKQLMCGQPASTAQDLLWHVGWFFSSQSAPRLNWSGFMHDIINADKLCLPCADVRMWPIIDLNPNDLTCVYSTLRFISDQSIPTPCITFDHPLWLKAVNIIQSEKLNIVCRLGPFHTMISFLASIGSVIAGSGLTNFLVKFHTMLIF